VGGDPLDHVLEVSGGVDPELLAAGDEGVEEGRAFSASGAASEGPVDPPQRDLTERALSPVVVDLEAAVREEAAEGLAVPLGVLDPLGREAGGAEGTLQLVEVSVELLYERPRLLLAEAAARRRIAPLLSRFALDRVELFVGGEDPDRRLLSRVSCIDEAAARVGVAADLDDRARLVELVEAARGVSLEEALIARQELVYPLPFLRSRGPAEARIQSQRVCLLMETPSRAKIPERRFSGVWSPYLRVITSAKSPGPGRPRSIGVVGKGAVVTPLWHFLQLCFLRTCSITTKLVGRNSSC